jgi:hypothetical protein
MRFSVSSSTFPVFSRDACAFVVSRFTEAALVWIVGDRAPSCSSVGAAVVRILGGAGASALAAFFDPLDGQQWDALALSQLELTFRVSIVGFSLRVPASRELRRKLSSSQLIVFQLDMRGVDQGPESPTFRSEGFLPAFLCEVDVLVSQAEPPAVIHHRERYELRVFRPREDSLTERAPVGKARYFLNLSRRNTITTFFGVQQLAQCDHRSFASERFGWSCFVVFAHVISLWTEVPSPCHARPGPT